MPSNTSAAQDRQIAEASSGVQNLIDIIEELDKSLSEANEKIEKLLEQLDQS